MNPTIWKRCTRGFKIFHAFSLCCRCQ